MRLALVNPNYLNKKKKLKLHLEVQRYPPLSLSYLASYVSGQHAASIIDAAAEELDEEETIRRILSHKPEVVGIYVTSFTLNQVKSLIINLRKKTLCKMILGGPHIIYFPESVKALGADYGVSGEGEITLLRLMDLLSEGKDPSSMPGLISVNKNKLRINSKPELVEDLDKLPFPDRRLLPNDRYFSPLHDGKITTMITSKGCIYDCIFCALPNKGTYRARSPENVVEEIKEIVSQGFDYIEIQDDLFTMQRGRIRRICELLLEKNIKIKWGCETRADMVDFELLKLMKKAGCTNIKFGIESGTERIRNKIIGKKLSEKAIRSALSAAKKTGMITIAYFMIGLPTETIDEMAKTIEFALETDPDYAEFHVPVPIPGSRIYDLAIGERKITRDMWSGVINGKDIDVYPSKMVEMPKLLSFRKKAYLRFYLRPKRIIKELRYISSFRDLVLKSKIALGIIGMG